MGEATLSDRNMLLCCVEVVMKDLLRSLVFIPPSKYILFQGCFCKVSINLNVTADYRRTLLKKVAKTTFHKKKENAKMLHSTL